MKICIYCGSKKGARPSYEAGALAFGREMIKAEMDLVYGAGNIGIMGLMADQMLEADRKVIGVIPQFLKDREVCHHGLTELHVTTDMHERKMKMAEIADGFVVLPGGIGTLDEFCEMFTWKQLRLVEKPLAILNVDGYYDEFIGFISKMEKEGFLYEGNQKLVFHTEDPKELVKYLQSVP